MSSSVNVNSRVTNGSQITGLASGMDTESMVEKMLSGTQSKIDKQMGLKTQTEWKQSIYRDVITKMDSFNTKYFTYFGSGNTNLLSAAFYNGVTTTSSSDAVKVLNSTSRAASQIKIDSITQLASAYTAKSSSPVSKALTAGSAANLAAGDYTVDISLDGVQKTVSFHLDAASDATGIATSINKSLETIWGSTVKFEDEGGKLKVTASDSTHTIILGNTKDTTTLTDMGFTDGASNKISYNSLLSEVPFETPLTDNQFAFKINGVEIKASMSDTVGDVISRINGSAAGVKVSYSAIEDKFIIESKTTGDIEGIKVEQTMGNLLSSMFGMGSGSGMSGSTSGLRKSDTITSGASYNEDLLEAIIDASNNGGQSLKLHVNGKAVEITIPAVADGDTPYDTTDKEAFIGVLNDQLDEMFGANNIKLSLGSDKKVSIKSKEGYLVSLDAEDMKHNLNDALGFSYNEDTLEDDLLNYTQKFDSGTTPVGNMGLEGTISLGGTDFTIQSTWALDDLITNFNTQFDGKAKLVYDEATDGIFLTDVTGTDVVLNAAAGSDGEKTLQTLFGKTEMIFNTSGGAVFDKTYSEATVGQNAKLVVNGNTIIRNSNEFELDGVTISLEKTTNTGDPAISLTTEKDTDTMIAGIKDFVEDYNNLIEELNGLLREDPNYRKYAPLTDAQKKEMTEKEIEKWEEKAKEGLLRNDINISSALGDMRAVLYQSVESAGGLALYQIGVDASDNYKDNGKLVLDEGKLKEALTTNLENVRKLFTDAKEGIAVQMNAVLKEAANVSSGDPGFLVQYAGSKDALNTENSLSKELKSIQEKIKTLNAKYEMERDRYWKQFSAMEQAISNMNNQSSWISQQFSS